MTFRSAPPGHTFLRPRTLYGTTKWTKAMPGTCPDCDLKGNYDGDRVRLYLGKGGAGERAARYGMWGPYGNGFWGGGHLGNGERGWVATTGGQMGYTGGYYMGYGMGYGGGYGQSFTPGEAAYRGFGGYGYEGKYKGGRYPMYPYGQQACCTIM
jgi:hypothetical protein